MVQDEETQIAHGDLSCCHSGLSDRHPGITWLAGKIEVNTKDFYYIIVTDRMQAGFTRLFNTYVEKEIIKITRGHASYSRAVQNNQCSHKIVNHFRVFENVKGFIQTILRIWVSFKVSDKENERCF
ncbi:hypothetical protein DMUE_1648 [Dictyocoela muelleri]|nr:hypothetical protein DMUE_1648 [Dictyocoela muelleri]